MGIFTNMTDLIKYTLLFAGTAVGVIVLAITVQEFIGFYYTAKAKTRKK